MKTFLFGCRQHDTNIYQIKFWSLWKTLHGNIVVSVLKLNWSQMQICHFNIHPRSHRFILFLKESSLKDNGLNYQVCRGGFCPVLGKSVGVVSDPAWWKCPRRRARDPPGLVFFAGNSPRTPKGPRVCGTSGLLTCSGMTKCILLTLWLYSRYSGRFQAEILEHLYCVNCFILYHSFVGNDWYLWIP